MDTQLINFTIPKLLLKDIDLLARKKKAARSELLREAVREYLKEEELRGLVFEAIRRTAKRVNLSEKEAMKLANEAKTWARRKS